MQVRKPQRDTFWAGGTWWPSQGEKSSEAGNLDGKRETREETDETLKV